VRGLDVVPTEIRAIGGGASSELWLQLQADVYGTPIHRMTIEEGAAYGAALLGHVVAGTFADVDEATSVVRTLDEVTQPVEAHVERYAELYDVYRELYATLRDDMHRLSALAAD
jgi:xylulokinase